MCWKAGRFWKPTPARSNWHPACARASPAGTGDAHRFRNLTDTDVLLLVVGDRSANDAVHYPDIDLHLAPQPDGSRRFLHKDGTPY